MKFGGRRAVSVLRLPTCRGVSYPRPSFSGRGDKSRHGLLAVFSECPGSRTCSQAGTPFWNSMLADGDIPGLTHRDEAGGTGQGHPALSWGDGWGSWPPLVSGRPRGSVVGPAGPGTGHGSRLTLTGCFPTKDMRPEPEAQGGGCRARGWSLCDQSLVVGYSGRA